LAQRLRCQAARNRRLYLAQQLRFRFIIERLQPCRFFNRCHGHVVLSEVVTVCSIRLSGCVKRTQVDLAGALVAFSLPPRAAVCGRPNVRARRGFDGVPPICMMAKGLVHFFTGREVAKSLVAALCSATRHVRLLGHGGTA
jgi:hypothetical protein